MPVAQAMFPIAHVTMRLAQAMFPIVHVPTPLAQAMFPIAHVPMPLAQTVFPIVQWQCWSFKLFSRSFVNMCCSFLRICRSWSCPLMLGSRSFKIERRSFKSWLRSLMIKCRSLQSWSCSLTSRCWAFMNICRALILCLRSLPARWYGICSCKAQTPTFFDTIPILSTKVWLTVVAFYLDDRPQL